MDEKKSVDRRDFLRKAAVTGVAAAWAAPVIQTVAASPAFAQTNGTPAPCDHSACVAACNSNPDCRGNAGLCEERCRALCPPGDPCSAACTAAGVCTPISGSGSAWANTCDPSCNGAASTAGVAGVGERPGDINLGNLLGR